MARDEGEPRRRILLEDVAQRAGVSRSTASRALADDPRISTPTRAAVKRAASELRYIPNVGARSLRVRRTRTFGLLIPELGDPVHGQVAAAFEAAARDEGFEVLLVSGYGDQALERTAMKTFAERGMDAVAIVSGTVSRAEASERLDPSRLVIALSEDEVVRGHPNDPGFIHIDEAGGVEAAVGHLVAGGYRRIAYVGSGSLTSNGCRRDACAAAVRGHDLDPLPPFESPPDAWRDPADLADQIALERPEAIVCYDDKLALAVMDALRSRGVRCPDDIGIVGFDRIPFASISNPRLTTVAVPSASIGRLAVSMLVTAIRTAALPAGIVLPLELVVAESTRSVVRTGEAVSARA